MKNKLITLLLTVTAALTMLPLSASASTFTPVTGWEMKDRLGMGINIGNTLEARPWSLSEFTGNLMDLETYWGTARIEQWQFKAIAQKGFGNVRIPVSWEPHMDENLIISKQWLDRVQQCVDWALAEGLIVTLNSHHESGFYDLMHDTARYDEARDWLLAVWGQIAERFKDYPETLIFEPMNEPRPGADGWYWCYDRFANQIPVLSRTANRLNRDVLALIRNSGGNNDRRVVALTITQADPNLIYLYEHPDDPYTMLGVFFYPGHSADYAQELNALEQIQTALGKGIPVVIKETSQLDTIASNSERLRWARFAYAELAALGVPSMWWNCIGTGPEELFDRATGVWNRRMVDAFFTAYGKTPGADFPAPLAALPYELPGPFSENAFTYWMPPRRELAVATHMVVEHSGAFTGGYMFTRFTSQWVQFAGGDGRITTEPGRIIFDIRGLEGVQLGFAAWGDGNTSRITRIYIDSLVPAHGFTTVDALRVLQYATGGISLTPEQYAMYDVNGDGVINTLDALEILRMVVG